MKLIVKYDPCGDKISDFEVESKYLLLLQHLKTISPWTFHCPSMLMITRIRVGFKEKDFDELDLHYDGIDYPINPDGTLDWWGKIPDYYMDYLLRLID